jgi:hypothetical protein
MTAKAASAKARMEDRLVDRLREGGKGCGSELFALAGTAQGVNAAQRPSMSPCRQG